MKTTITIEVVSEKTLDWNDEEGNFDEATTKAFEKRIHSAIHSALENYMEDKLEEDALENINDDYDIEHIDSMSELGTISIKIKQE